MKKPGLSQHGRSSFGWYIQTLSRIIESGMQLRLAPLGLKIPEFVCIMALLEKEGASQAEIGRITGAPEYATSRTIEKLVKAGLVKRLSDPESRRTHQIFFTKKGKTLAGQLPAIAKANNDHVLAGLNKTQRAQLEELLGKIVEHLV